MTERAIFLLRDDATAEQLVEIASLWTIPCNKMDKKYVDTSLVKLARTAGALIVRELDMWPPRAVAVELDADLATQLTTDLRLRTQDGVMAAFWFSRQLQERVAFMVLTCNRIKKVLNGIDNAERYSELHAEAAKRQIKRESVLGSLDLSSSRAAAVQEQDAVIAQVRAEVLASLL